MTLTNEEIGRLLKRIQETQQVEMTCPDCLDELDKYTQKVLDGTQIDAELLQVREHLESCSYCNDQFKLVLETLDAVTGTGSQS